MASLLAKRDMDVYSRQYYEPVSSKIAARGSSATGLTSIQALRINTKEGKAKGWHINSKIEHGRVLVSVDR